MTGLFILALLDTKLQLDLSPGLVRMYEATRNYTGVTEPDKTGFVDQVLFKVEKEKEDDRAKLTVSYSLLKRSMDGLDLPPPTDKETTVVHEQRTGNGLVFLREEIPYEGVDRQRQIRALDVMFPNDPVKVGSVWGRDISVNNGDGFPPVHWQWTCAALDDKTVTLTLEYTERECLNPITADGTIVLERSSGWPVSVDVKLHNTIVPGNLENIVVDLHVVWRKL